MRDYLYCSSGRVADLGTNNYMRLLRGGHHRFSFRVLYGSFDDHNSENPRMPPSSVVGIE